MSKVSVIRNMYNAAAAGVAILLGARRAGALARRRSEVQRLAEGASALHMATNKKSKKK